MDAWLNKAIANEKGLTFFKVSKDHLVKDLAGDMSPSFLNKSPKADNSPLVDLFSKEDGEVILGIIELLTTVDKKECFALLSDAQYKGEVWLDSDDYFLMVIKYKQNHQEDFLSFFNIADVLPFYIAYVDKNLCYQFNNLAYEQLFQVDRQHLKGKSIRDYLGEDAFAQVEPHIKQVLSGEEVTLKNTLNIPTGGLKDFDVHYIPHQKNNRVHGFFAIINDVTEYNSSIRLLKEIHDIIHAPEHTPKDTIDKLLSLGRQYLNLPIAILAQVLDKDYTIKAVSTDLEGLNPDDKFDLGITYCIVTLKAHDVVATNFAGEDKTFKAHPCYENFQLETYIGVPIHLHGQVFGTLNFSAPQKREKPFTELEIELLRLMATAMETLLVREEDIKETEKEIQQLETKANIDPLTQLPNRNVLDEVIPDILREIKEQAHDVCLCVIDVDHFKAINDNYGHQSGDKVLKSLSSIFVSYLRKPDMVLRIGGEEFLIILHDAKLVHAKDIIDRLCRVIADIPFEVADMKHIQVTISGGVTVCQNDENFNSMLTRADDALYQAKQNGRNQIVAKG